MNRGFDESPVLEEPARPHAQAGLQCPGPVLICVRTSASTETEFQFFGRNMFCFSMTSSCCDTFAETKERKLETKEEEQKRL